MATFILSFSKLKRGNEPVKVIRKTEKYLLPFFFRAGEEVLGVSRIAMGFPVVSSDLTVMCKQYLNPKWSAGGCEWEWEVLAALRLP